MNTHFGLLGCKHYSKNCLIITNCCKKKYHCKMCHDENETHKTFTNDITNMICLFCGQNQNCSNYCKHCGKAMARYYCHLCRFWSCDTNIFHCDKCKLCRIGDCREYFHCNDCNACMQNELYNEHRHIENTLKSTCPICAEYMFDSKNDIIMMLCGHSIHNECFEIYKQSSVQCPVCLKSAGDMKQVYNKIEFMIDKNDVLHVDENYMCEMICYDCRIISNNRYNFLYNKCSSCGSINTKINELYKD